MLGVVVSKTVFAQGVAHTKLREMYIVRAGRRPIPAAANKKKLYYINS